MPQLPSLQEQEIKLIISEEIPYSYLKRSHRRGPTKNPLQQESTAISTALRQGNKQPVSEMPVMFTGQSDVFHLANHGTQITRPGFIGLKVNGKPMAFCQALNIRFTKRVENKNYYLFQKQHHLYCRESASILTFDFKEEINYRNYHNYAYWQLSNARNCILLSRITL